MNALEIRDLTKHYTGFSPNHLNLTLPWGCIMGLVGENGAGKSTMMNVLAAFIQKRLVISRCLVRLIRRKILVTRRAPVLPLSIRS